MAAVQPPPAAQDPERQDPDRQDPEPQDPDRPTQHPDEGKIVRAIRIEPDVEYANSLVRILRTRVDEPLRRATIAEDLNNLWRLRQIRATVELDDADGGVVVIFVIDEQRAFDRFEFRGLDDMSEREVMTLLGISKGQRINRVAAEKHWLTLRDRYQRNGFAFVNGRIDEDPDRSVLTLYVDEGPKVTVDQVWFRGNRAFPSWAFLGLMQNLKGSSGMKSRDRFLSNAPYSQEIVEEDLDRLRFFYRKQGYRDARVELASVDFSRHHDSVQLTIRIVEGRRYRIGKVSVEAILEDGSEDPDPLYPSEEVLEALSIEVGDYFDQDRVDLDKIAIEEFYGSRGHPSTTTGVTDGFFLPEPVEVFDTEKAEIEIVFQVIEGSPKKLRDVVIRGNTETKDFVVRRKVFLFPGEVLDTTKIDKSIRVLNSLRYFQDVSDPVGVRYELLPVQDDPDALDLAIDVQEGDTGQFLWGAGVSTASGVVGRFVFSKRNFDIGRLPTSANPIEAVRQIARGEAFHGGGQNLELMLAPGTEISLFQVSFFDPDIFSRHFDTIGMRVNGFRRLQFLDSFDMDALGAGISINRAFTEEFDVGISVRQETVEVRGVDPNAPTIVFDAEGSTEMRGVGLNVVYQDVDDFLTPTDGYRMRGYGEVVGGPFGGDTSFYRLGASYQRYLPLHRDARGRAHVFHLRTRFDYGKAFDEDEDLFLTQRFYMGGSTLRGFDQRRAGPSQFGEPLGGEVRGLATVEYVFPLVSTRRERGLRETEMLRGVVFSDLGVLGLDIEDDELGKPRLSVGIGVRIFVPVFEVPIALDLGWPVLDQDTDQQRQFFFSLSHF